MNKMIISMYFEVTVRILVKIVGVMGFCPYKYYPAHRHFRIYRVYWDRAVLIWILSMCKTLVFLPTHFWHLYQVTDVPQMLFVIVLFLLITCSNILVGMQIIKPKPFCQGLNAVWRLLQTLPEMYVPQHDVRRDKKIMNIFHFFIFLSALTVVAFTVIFILHFFCFPFSAPYLSFNIPPQYMFFWVILISCLWIVYLSIGMGANLALFFIYAIAYFLFIMPIFRNELKMDQAHYKTKPQFRHPLNLLVNWRSIEIFVVNVTDNEFGFIFIPLQMTVSLLTLIANVTLVRHSRFLESYIFLLLIFILILATVGWAIFLHQAGKQYQLSVKVLKTWRPSAWTCADRKYMRKVRKACRPIWIGDGKRYVIRPVSVLTFLRSLSKNTLRALITYGKVYGQ